MNYIISSGTTTIPLYEAEYDLIIREIAGLDLYTQEIYDYIGREYSFLQWNVVIDSHVPDGYAYVIKNIDINY